MHNFCYATLTLHLIIETYKCILLAIIILKSKIKLHKKHTYIEANKQTSLNRT